MYGKNETRRTYLKGLGVVSLGSSQLATISSASNVRNRPVIFLKGGVDNSISLDEIVKARRKLRETSTVVDNDAPEMGFRPTNLEPDDSIVSYVAGIDEDGVIRHSTGIANTQRAYDRLMERESDRAVAYRNGNFRQFDRRLRGDANGNR